MAVLLTYTALTNALISFLLIFSTLIWKISPMTSLRYHECNAPLAPQKTPPEECSSAGRSFNLHDAKSYNSLCGMPYRTAAPTLAAWISCHGHHEPGEHSAPVASLHPLPSTSVPLISIMGSHQKKLLCLSAFKVPTDKAQGGSLWCGRSCTVVWIRTCFTTPLRPIGDT